MRGRYVGHSIVFIHDHGSVMCKARHEARAEKCERVESGADFHDSDLEIVFGGMESLANRPRECCHENVIRRTEVITRNPIVEF
jgi:hypothetical protein